MDEALRARMTDAAKGLVKRKMPKGVAMVIGVVLGIAVIATVLGGYSLKLHSPLVDLEMQPGAHRPTSAP